MKMAVDHGIDDDDNDDDDYDDDDDVGTLMNRIKQIYADFHKKILLSGKTLALQTN